MRSEIGAACVVLSLAACGGSVVEGPSDTSTGSGTTTTSETFTTGSTGSFSGGGGAGGATKCTPAEGGTGGFVQPTCDDLAVMNVTNPLLVDEGGNGKLKYGESAKVTVKLNEIAGVGFNFYPGVRFSSDSDALSIPAPDNSWFYAIFPCESYDASADIKLYMNMPKGVVMYVKAQVGMLNADCPDAPSIFIPVEIE